MADVKISELTALTTPDGAEELVVNDNGVTKKIRTDDLFAGDNVKAKFGASDDLQIYHDGSNSYIKEAGTGNLAVGANEFYLYNSDYTEVKIGAVTDGAVTLYNDNAPKLATTSTGVDVTGTVTADHVVAQGNAPQLRWDEQDTTDQNFGMRLNNGAMIFEHRTDDFSTQTERARIDSSGNVGIGTSSPSSKLDVGSSADAVTNMTASAEGIDRFSGGGYSFAIANNGTGTYLYNNGSSRALIFGNNETERARIDSSGNVGIGTTSPNDTLDVHGGNIVNPNNTGSEITSATIGLGSNIHLEERQPNGAYSDRTDLVWKTNQGYGLGERDQMRLDSGGNLTLAGGVYLGGTGAANKLDDYETGTWTPTASSTSTAPTIGTYSDRAGTYIKVGDLVVATCQMRFTCSSVGSGTPTVIGLPFANTNNIDGVALGIMNSLDQDATGVGENNYVVGSTVYFSNSNYITSTGSGNYLTFTVSYRTNA